MNILMKKNIIFETVSDKKIFKNKVLSFILDNKAKNILYKGNVNDIDYKTLKKILPLNDVEYDKNQEGFNKFIVKNKSKSVREVYQELLDKIDNELCIIYKK